MLEFYTRVRDWVWDKGLGSMGVRVKFYLLVFKTGTADLLLIGRI